jgi:hypothetical protein
LRPTSIPTSLFVFGNGCTSVSTNNETKAHSSHD